MNLKISFQGWILLGSFLVVLCTLIFVAIILQGSLREQLVQNTQAALSQELSLVGEVIKKRWKPEDPSTENDKLADQIGQLLNLRLTLIRPDGVVIGDSHVAPEELERLENHAGRPEVVEAMKNGQGASIRRSTTVGVDLLYMAEILRPPGQPPLVVRLAMPLSEVDQTLAHTRRLIFGAVFLGLVLSFGVAYLVARGISKPVKELTKTAASIAGGDLSRRLTRYPSHEVGELGRAFDSMADSLQQQIEAVTKARDRLEAVLRGMVEGVLLIDQNNQVLLANRALKDMLGLSADPAGQAASDVIRNADWIIHIDVDEFINVRCGNGTLFDFFDRVPQATNVAMTWRLFGHNGVRELSDDLVIEQFDTCAPKFCPKPHTVWGFKTMFRNMGAYAKISCHRPNKLSDAFRDHVHWVNGSGQPMGDEVKDNGWRSSQRSIGYDLIQLNHYALRSAESFLIKRQRGRALHVDRSIGLNYWIRMDWSDHKDVTIQRNTPRTRAEMARLLADDRLRALHEGSMQWHRDKAASLRANPEFRELYEQALATRLTSTERVAYALALDMES